MIKIGEKYSFLHCYPPPFLEEVPFLYYPFQSKHLLVPFSANFQDAIPPPFVKGLSTMIDLLNMTTCEALYHSGTILLLLLLVFFVCFHLLFFNPILH